MEQSDHKPCVAVLIFYSVTFIQIYLDLVNIHVHILTNQINMHV